MLRGVSVLRSSTAVVMLFAMGLTNAQAADVTITNGQTVGRQTLNDGDTITVDQGGTISVTSLFNGISISRNATVTATINGDVSSTMGGGIWGDNNSSLSSSIGANGTITAAHTAVSASNITNFNNSGNVYSQRSGLRTNGDLGTFVNSGTFTAENGNIVFAGGDITSINNSGMLMTDSDGLGIIARGNLGILDNSGTIKGYDAVNIAGRITNFTNTGNIDASAGTRSGFRRGIFTQSIANFNNSGTISSSNGIAININGLSPTTDGDIGTAVNSGTISGGFWGISARELTNFHNTSTGNIIGTTSSAILAPEIGTLVNDGIIGGSGSTAIATTNVGNFTNTGTVTANFTSLNAQRINSFNNSGTMNGQISASSTGFGSFLNTGSITGSHTAVFASGSDTTMINRGTITSTGTYSGSAMFLAMKTALDNYGTISAGATGVTIGPNAEDTVISNYGTITGLIGVNVYSTAKNTVINNYGTINSTRTSSTPHALQFNGTNSMNTLNIYGGNINGLVSWDGTDDTINFISGGNFEIDVTNNPDSVSFASGSGINADGKVVQLEAGANAIASDLGVGISQSFSSNIGNRFSSTGINGGDSLTNGNGYAFAPPDSASRAVWSSFWATAARQDNTSVTTSVAGGFMGGVDWTEQNGELIGIMAGYGVGKIDTAGAFGQEIDTSTFAIGVYGRKNHHDLLLDYKLTAGVIGFDSVRQVSSGGGTATATADYNGVFIAPEVTFIREYDAARSLFTLGYTGLFIDGYTETGGSGATFGARDSHYVSARAEYEFNKDMAGANGDNIMFRPYLGLEGGLAFGDFNSGTITIAGTSTNYNSATDNKNLRGFAGVRFGKNLNETTMLFGSAEVGYDNNKTVSGKVQFGISKRF